MKDNKFLLTFYDEEYGSYSYNWYENEEDMKEDIKRHSEWSDFEATEVLSSRNIEI
jgi:hypothetical protein